MKVNIPVFFIAHILSIHEEPTPTLVLDDGTGMTQIKLFSGVKIFQKVQAGDYVKKIDNFNEITFHSLEVIYSNSIQKNENVELK
ncbi:hypothetical protein M0811_07412 [Anaeramoeba ignava]|uniref:Uncharacterized protein n=1 Tax=Anaeramoeba ignava TaxID=1746090 RepID=A0A9Q0LMA9_ANAIG|nr:hypothetical protein M0811_07412 [Anaeramoeba ignava]